jgi:hypothetical protein
MKNTLYLLDRQYPGWDEIQGAVVSANTEKQARELAKTLRGDQPSSVWDSTDPEELVVRVIGQTDEPIGVVFISVNAG